MTVAHFNRVIGGMSEEERMERALDDDKMSMLGAVSHLETSIELYLRRNPGTIRSRSDATGCE